MTKTAILYPAIAMALLTLALLVAMALRRWAAMKSRAVSIKFYRTYSEGAEPEELRKHTRHVANHFEVPPLFHLAVFGTYLAGEVTMATVGAAWLFVASRCVHSVIHLGYNNVLHRFYFFGIGVLAVVYLWARLLVALH
jgi:hypothetical protein